MTPELADRVRRIELLLLDVDGVLTDGRIVYSDDGAELKSFHVRDGAGIKCWRDSGKRLAIVSGRRSAATDRRAAELGITTVIQGAGEKSLALERILSESGLVPEQVCAMGDDLPDLLLFRRCGIGIAVADACAELRAIASHVTATPGGHGAVREAIEWLMRGQGTWEAAIRM